MTRLEQVPARIDALASQISQLRTEMRDEFSAVRSEMAEQGAAISATLRQEMAAQGAALRSEVRSELRSEIGGLGAQMRLLHEDVISRIAQLQEGWPPPPGRTPRTKK